MVPSEKTWAARHSKASAVESNKAKAAVMVHENMVGAEIVGACETYEAGS